VRGTFLQTSTPPVVDPPVLLWLDPTVVKVQNNSSAHTTLVVDNRRGSRPQKVAIPAADEGAMRFSLAPERLVGAGGQVRHDEDQDPCLAAGRRRDLHAAAHRVRLERRGGRRDRGALRPGLLGPGGRWPAPPSSCESTTLATSRTNPLRTSAGRGDCSGSSIP
jgi:hypothetical protein